MNATVVLENIGDEQNEQWRKLIVFDTLWDDCNPEYLTCWSPSTGHSACDIEYLIDGTVWVTDEVAIEAIHQYERLVGMDRGSYDYVPRKRFINELFMEEIL